jgi:glutamate--cysteine ligase
LTWCLLQDSPPLDSDESRQCAQNVTSTALSGRDPELKLLRREGEIGLRQWGEELIKSIEPVALLLDEVNHGGGYQQAIDEIGQRLRDDSLLPSARILDEMEENGESFFHFAMRKAVGHEKNFKSDKLNEEKWRWFEDLASASLRHQQQIEESDSLSFDQFLAQYFAG